MLKVNFCSTANPVTSLEFSPTWCATKLCHFDRTQNGPVATHFFLLSSAARSSATGDYLAVRERLSQNAEPASKKELNRKKCSSVPKNIPKRCTVKSCIFATRNHVILVKICSILMSCLTFSYYGLSFDLVFFVPLFVVSTRDWALWCLFWWIRNVQLCVERWKRRSLRG